MSPLVVQKFIVPGAFLESGGDNELRWPLHDQRGIALCGNVLS